MAYNSTGLVVHDADAHIMETPTWLRDNADPAFRDRIDALTYPGGNELQQSAIEFDENEDLVAGFERLAQRHQAPDYVAAEEAEIMLRKNYAATGSFIAEDRPRALDILGFASQLVFNTFYNSRLCEWDHSGDVDFAIGTARAHNRGISEFCSVDRRLLSTLYVPLADLDRAPALAEEAIEMGAGALLIASACPPGHSPSHIGLYIDASLGMGMNKFMTFTKITLPLIYKGLVAGGALVFLSTMKELPQTLLLRPTGLNTMAVDVWSYASEGLFTNAAFSAFILLAISAFPTYILSTRNLTR